MNKIYFGDNLPLLRTLASESVALIYIDPPFNTGKAQARTQIKTVRAEAGDRTGFKGQRYKTIRLGQRAFGDNFKSSDDFLAFLEPRLVEAKRILAPDGSLYFHIDYREAHYCKVLLDRIFGRACFLNEIIWAYDYGARTRRKWPPKHDNILWYAKDPNDYIFNYDEIERIPYMAPGLVGPEKAARGKTPTDCYSADTDILTHRGWVPFPELNSTDEVASVTPEGEIVYVQPTKYHCYPYQGEMYQFSTRAINLLVTPNHHLYVRPKHRRAYQFVRADMVGSGQYSQSVYYALTNHLGWRGNALTESYQVPAYNYKRPSTSGPLPVFDLGDWCEFIGLYLSEGSSTFYRDRAEVIIAQEKPENLEHIENLLRRMKLSFHYNGRAFVICNKQLASYLKQFGKAHEKYIPAALLSVTPVYLERLYSGLMRGDGYVGKGDHSGEILYITTSKRLADNVQELFLKLGSNSSISERHRDPEKHPAWRSSYAVSRRRARESTIFPHQHARRVPYEGNVYCCTVEPYHTLIVRRAGKPAVCGNCWWMTIVSPTGKEKTGYPTQKPLGLLKRIIQASSRPGDTVLDFFAGSGTAGEAAFQLGRKFILIDNNEAALQVMARRLAHVPELELVYFDSKPPEGTSPAHRLRPSSRQSGSRK